MVRAVLADYRTAPVEERLKALFGFIEKVNLEPSQVSAEDVEAVRQQGWTDEAIYDAVTVCALFNFYNRWVDATGVHEMTPEAHRESGRRLATLGYAQAAARAD
jgi:alkylhydroperoxidase family enzyme